MKTLLADGANSYARKKREAGRHHALMKLVARTEMTPRLIAPLDIPRSLADFPGGERDQCAEHSLH